MKAALYARFSTDLQNETTIDDQLRLCRKHVEKEGWEIVATFDDRALSGTNPDRPGYRAVIEGALRGDFEMIVASEIWSHDDYKRRIIEMGPADTRVIMSIFGDNSRVIDNPDSARVAELERDGVDDFEAYRPLVQGTLQREAYETGDWRRGTMSVGQACSFADAIEPVEAIVDRIIADAVRARDRVAALGAVGPTGP